MGIITDVTEFHKLKSEMIKAAKNESINILAGGLVHDFNNVLLLVLGNLILARTRMDNGCDVSELLNSIEETIASGTGLTRQLLSFSRDNDLDFDIISMRQLLKRTVRFTASGSKIKTSYNLQKDLSPVSADRNQIVKVVTNLVINAKQAMHDGWMELQNHHLGGAIFTFYLPAANAMVSLEEEYINNNTFSGKILIVDDIKDARIALKYIFADLGLTVDIAENGEFAFEMIMDCAEDDPYVLVIADLTVQEGFGAVKLLEKVRKHSDDTKILVFSGHTNKEEIKNLEDVGFAGSFVKPFTINELKNKLDLVLNN